MAYPKSRGCPWVILVPVITLTAVEFMARQGAEELTMVHKGGSPSCAPRLTTMMEGFRLSLALTSDEGATSELEGSGRPAVAVASSPDDIFPEDNKTGTPFLGNEDLQLQRKMMIMTFLYLCVHFSLSVKIFTFEYILRINTL